MDEPKVIEILHRYSGSVLYRAEAISLREAILKALREKANLSSADLRSANLSWADLRSANLRSANLSSADLSSADLSSANLRSANLSWADLRSANLSSADLRSANLSSADLSSADLSSADLSSIKANWRSHRLIAHLLLREAGSSVAKRKVAGLIAVSQDWCWPDFLKLRRNRHFSWAIDVLASYVQEGDGAPEILRERAAALKAATPAAPSQT